VGARLAQLDRVTETKIDEGWVDRVVIFSILIRSGSILGLTLAV